MVCVARQTFSQCRKAAQMISAILDLESHSSNDSPRRCNLRSGCALFVRGHWIVFVQVKEVLASEHILWAFEVAIVVDLERWQICGFVATDPGAAVVVPT